MAVTSRADTPAPTSADAPVRERVLAATVRCLADQGLRSTTLDDIAGAAGCGRATIYRVFPGGRRGVLLAAVDHQIASVLDTAGAAADAADHLAGAVAAAVAASSRALAEHAAFQRLLAEDPGSVLPFMTFDGAGPLLARAGEWGRAHLVRFVDPTTAEIAGEWAARVVLGRLHAPPTITTADPAVARRLVDRYLVPGLPDLHRPAPS